MESRHTSSHVILKVNINQFCIVGCPEAVRNTCSVFAGMDDTDASLLKLQITVKRLRCSARFIMLDIRLPCRGQ